jgi:antitoxin ParD1/3/4
MTRMQISLPEPLREFVKERVESGKYRTTSDYIADLVRRDQQAQDEQQQLENLLLAGLDSPLSEMTAADWAEIRRVALERLAARQPA